jgi:hypothetical protein
MRSLASRLVAPRGRFHRDGSDAGAALALMGVMALLTALAGIGLTLASALDVACADASSAPPLPVAAPLQAACTRRA